MATETLPEDQNLPNTQPFIRQTDCQYQFGKDAVTLTLKFLGDTKRVVNLARSYRPGTVVTTATLIHDFKELENINENDVLGELATVTSSVSQTKTGSASATITLQIPYDKGIEFTGQDKPDQEIIQTWSEKSTNQEFPLEVYAGDYPSDSTEFACAADFDAWKKEENKNIENYKNFKYELNGQLVELQGRTRELAELFYQGVDHVSRAYPEVIRTTQYINLKGSSDGGDEDVDRKVINAIEEKPNLYYIDNATPNAVWQDKFPDFSWLKASYDVETEATEYEEYWNATVTESWIGISVAERGAWNAGLYGPDGGSPETEDFTTRWKFATAEETPPLPEPPEPTHPETIIEDVNGVKYYREWTGRISRSDYLDIPERLVSVDFGTTVHAIDDQAFENQPYLATIECPEVSYIGDGAFEYCIGLLNAPLSEKVTYLGEYAFHGDAALQSINPIKPSIYAIPTSCFEGCTSLIAPIGGTTINIGGNVKGVDANAFKGCTSLNGISFSNAVGAIGENAFDGDTSLAIFKVPTDGSGTIILGDEAFKDCSALSNIEIPVGTITVGTDSFLNAFASEVTVKAPKSFLTNLPVTSSYNYIYPAFVDTMSAGEWRDDTKLLSAVVCDAITSIPENAFRGCSNCTSVTLPDTITSITHDAFRQSGITSFVVPPLMTGTLAYNMFYQCTALESVDFNNVTLLGADIFAGCTSLTELINEDKLTSIQARAFSDCAFVEFNGGSGLAGLGQSCFRRNAALKSFKIPENETGSLTIGATAFDSCTALERIEIPVGGTLTIGTTIFNNGLASEIWLKAPFNADLLASIPSGKAINFIYPSFTTSIAANAWQNDTRLVGVAIPDSVTSIGDNAFNGTRISSITIGENVTSIGNAAFRSNTAMTEATLNPGSTGIGAHAFNGNTALQTINIGGTTLTTIPNNFAKNCSALTTVNVTAPLTTIANGTDANNGAFINCTALTAIDFLPNTLTTIGDYAFKSCNRVNSVTIPSSVTTIGAQVFAGCSALLSLTIPSSVTSIGSIAFNYMGTSSNLPTVTMQGKTTTDVQGMTNYPWGLRTGATIHCSDGDITIS